MKEQHTTGNVFPISKKQLDAARKEYRKTLGLPAELVGELQHGSDAAIQKLYLHLSKPLYNFIKSLLQDGEEAKEVVHDTFEYLLVKRETIDFSKNVKAFLFKCARNKALDCIKSRKVRERYQSLPDYDDDHAPAHDEIYVTKEIELLIEFAISNMPERRRQIIQMYRNEGKTPKEIASELGLSEKTVYRHMDEAKNDIRTIIHVVTFLLMV